MKKLIFLTVLSLVVVLANSAFGSPVFLPQTGHYYEIYYAELITWQGALGESFDKSYMGVQGHLVTIMEEYEQAVANWLRRNLFDTLNNWQSELGTCWIGLSRESGMSPWQWVTGEYMYAQYQYEYFWYFQYPEGVEKTTDHFARMVNWYGDDSGRWQSVGNGDTVYSGSYIVEYDGPFPVIPEPVPVIPEPGAILLGSIGAGLVGWLRRRRTL